MKYLKIIEVLNIYLILWLISHFTIEYLFYINPSVYLDSMDNSTPLYIFIDFIHAAYQINPIFIIICFIFTVRELKRNENANKRKRLIFYLIPLSFMMFFLVWFLIATLYLYLVHVFLCIIN